jgi:hypothetical protein
LDKDNSARETLEKAKEGRLRLAKEWLRFALTKETVGGVRSSAASRCPIKHAVTREVADLFRCRSISFCTIRG